MMSPPDGAAVEEALTKRRILACCLIIAISCVLVVTRSQAGEDAARIVSKYINSNKLGVTA